MVDWTLNLRKGTKMMRSSLIAGWLVLGLTCTSWADPAGKDLGQNRQQPVSLQFDNRDVDLVVEVDEKFKIARLIVPASLLMAKQPQVGARVGMLNHIIPGIALSCALVTGGLWLVRKGKGRNLATFLVTVCMFTAGVSLVWADIPGPHGEPAQPIDHSGMMPIPANPQVPLTQITLPTGIEFTGKLVLEVVPDGDKVTLIVAKNMVKPIKKATKTIGWD
jgi:hypothetical protein